MNQEVGVNLSYYQLQGVTGYSHNPMTSNYFIGPLISNQDYIDFGRTQKWHGIKFYLEGVDFAETIKYLLSPGLTVNSTGISGWGIDNSGQIWNVNTNISYTATNGSNTVIWSSIGSMEFIVMI